MSYLYKWISDFLPFLLATWYEGFCCFIIRNVSMCFRLFSCWYIIMSLIRLSWYLCFMQWNNNNYMPFLWSRIPSSIEWFCSYKLLLYRISNSYHFWSFITWASSSLKKNLRCLEINCIKGFYDVWDEANLNDPICKPCHYSCTACYGPLSTNCIDCNTLLRLNHTV